MLNSFIKVNKHVHNLYIVKDRQIMKDSIYRSIQIQKTREEKEGIKIAAFEKRYFWVRNREGEALIKSERGRLGFCSENQGCWAIRVLRPKLVSIFSSFFINS